MHSGSGGGKCYQEKQRIENVGVALFNKVDRGGLLECHLSTEGWRRGGSHREIWGDL